MATQPGLKLPGANVWYLLFSDHPTTDYWLIIVVHHHPSALSTVIMKHQYQPLNITVIRQVKTSQLAVGVPLILTSQLMPQLRQEQLDTVARQLNRLAQDLENTKVELAEALSMEADGWWLSNG